MSRSRSPSGVELNQGGRVPSAHGPRTAAGRPGSAQGALRGRARRSSRHPVRRGRRWARASPARSQTGRALAEAGLHPASGGDGTQLCSGDMLLEALTACAGVTLRAVATSIGIEVRGGSVRAEGDLDFRGTLAVDRDAPVGFSEIRLSFDLDTEASDEELATLLKLTERYCVVFQTPRRPRRRGLVARPRRPPCLARCATSGSWRGRGRRSARASATTARPWPSSRRARRAGRPGSRSNGWASPATG